MEENVPTRGGEAAEWPDIGHGGVWLGMSSDLR